MATKMNFASLLESIEKVTKKTYEDDSSNYWKPTKDKTGNATALIRFLPSKNIEDVPFVRMFSHSFQDPTTKRWYFENSLSTIGGIDEIARANKELWDTGTEENQKIVKLRKRKLSYICNIYIIKDAGNPENDGKVMRYKFGQKIFEKIVSAAKPDEMIGEVPINAFDAYDGADFLLKMVKANDQYNYDQSKFTSKKPMFDGDDDKIDTALEQCFDITEEVAPTKFKSEEDLKKKFLWVIGQEKVQNNDNDEIKQLEKLVDKENKKEEAKKEEKKKPPLPVMTDSGDDDSAFFASLIED